MFYHLFRYLDKFYDIPGAGMFNYISFKTGLSFIFALLSAIWDWKGSFQKKELPLWVELLLSMLFLSRLYFLPT